MGFIRVIYANDRKIMAIRANTAKYGSLTEKKQPYGVPGRKRPGIWRLRGESFHPIKEDREKLIQNLPFG